MQVTVSRDLLNPGLRALAAKAENTRPLLQAMGLVAVQITKRAFNDPSLRPAPWVPKADGTPATLRLNQLLARSPRLISFDQQKAIIGSDRPYASIHQLGGHTGPHIIKPKKKKALKTPWGPKKSVKHPGSKMPPRPFFPWDGSGRPTAYLVARAGETVGQRLGLGPAK